jgi:nicotinamidase-related amidase
MSQLARTAVVIIDVQNAILRDLGGHRNAEALRALDGVVSRIARLLAAARENAVPVVYVQHDGGPGHRLERGTEGWRIRSEIAPLPGEPVVEKRFCDSFFETTLDAGLRALGINRLIVAGCVTQYCVDTSVRRAVSLGYDVVLASDGHATVDVGGLSFEQIVAHHNFVLDGFDAGEHAVSVKPCAAITF